MLRGLLTLTWLEIKVFVREPLGVIGTIVIPVAFFLLVGRFLGQRMPAAALAANAFVAVGLPVLATLMITIGTVLSLVTIVSVYREGGILKRLRATPLRPATILAAHVLVKLLATALTLSALLVVGRRFYPVGLTVPVVDFGLAVVISTLSIMALGFLLASYVPTARFAQPLGALVLYPMLALSGLFAPIEALPGAIQVVARILPLTYAVSLLQGMWVGEPWSAHLGDLAGLVVWGGLCTAWSHRVFRWE